MESHATIKIEWATDGGGSGVKVLKKYFNMEPRVFIEALTSHGERVSSPAYVWI